MYEPDSNSTAPTIISNSCSASLHEHDWRDSSFDIKTAATVHLDGETVEGPYSDLYRSSESDGHRSQPQARDQPRGQAQPQPQGNTMNTQQQQNEHEEIVHKRSSSNYHTDSAQGPSDPSDSYNNDDDGHRPMPGYVPNKYSAHHDPNMPDWEGATIAERTMADISTLSPPPDDYYNPYVAPPVVMVAASHGTHWEVLEETDEERADWRNPKYDGGGSGGKTEMSTISGEMSALQARNRKLLLGLLASIVLLVVVAGVAGVVALKTVDNDEDADNVVGVTPSIPSSMPSVLKLCDNAPCETNKPESENKPETDDTPVKDQEVSADATTGTKNGRTG